MERNCQCRNSSWSNRNNDLLTHFGIQIQMLLAYSWMAFYVFAYAPVPVFVYLPQQTTGNLQQTTGLHQPCIFYVELWCCGTDLHPLERPT